MEQPNIQFAVGFTIRLGDSMQMAEGVAMADRLRDICLEMMNQEFVGDLSNMADVTRAFEDLRAIARRMRASGHKGSE